MSQPAWRRTSRGSSSSAQEVGSADGTGAAARFNQPSSVVVDTAGNVYVADQLNATFRKITAAGVTTTVAGTAGVAGVVLGSSPRFSFLRGLDGPRSGSSQNSSSSRRKNASFDSSMSAMP